MFRFALVVLVLSGCSKSGPRKEGQAEPTGTPGLTTGDVEGKGEKIAVHGGDVKETGAPGKGAEMFRLHPDEGAVQIDPPAAATTGTEAIAKVAVVPTSEYHVNLEFPIKLTLQTPAGVTIAKTELAAGGPNKVKGDADQFGEHQLAFAVKLTPKQSGTHTISGELKFAVCTKDNKQCLPKTEPIAIQVAAK